MSKNNLRASAAKVIAAVEKGASLATALPAEECRIDEKHHPLLRQLCYGTTRHYFSLCVLRKMLVAKPVKAKEQAVNALLLIGLYQLVYSRIPAHAAVTETVNAALALKKPWAKGLINAVLRSLQRQKNTLIPQITETPEAQYEHPIWLINILQQHWPEQWKDLLRANNIQAPMTLRVNRQHHSREEYLTHLHQADIQAFETSLSSEGITLTEACSVDTLPGFQQGWVSVQDEAAQLSAALLDCQPGERVLDACAAPGGKTCHLLERTHSLDMWAVDIDKERLSRIQQNLDRLQLKAHLCSGDASTPETWWDNQFFDRILLDAPCSATGVIRRHPDIKLLRRASDIHDLAKLQYTILQKVWRLLKPGGTLLYATCSIIPEENSMQIKRFLTEQADAMLQPVLIKSVKKDSLINTSETFGIQLLPVQGKHDGFFYSVLSKRLQDK